MNIKRMREREKERQREREREIITQKHVYSNGAVTAKLTRILICKWVSSEGPLQLASVLEFFQGSAFPIL